MLGQLTRVHTRRTYAFNALAERVAQQRIEREHSAVAKERLRIGRELHDVIAQNVSAIILQSNGARERIRDNPQSASESILAVEQAARQGLVDLRRTLRLVRTPDDPRPLTPSPRLTHLSELARAASDLGMTWELRTPSDHAHADLPPGIDLVGYRVIETALNAAAAHGARSATVTIDYQTNYLDIDVRADRPIATDDERLAGISERVALYHGTMHLIAKSRDGFELHARMPLNAGAR